MLIFGKVKLGLGLPCRVKRKKEKLKLRGRGIVWGPRSAHGIAPMYEMAIILVHFNTQEEHKKSSYQTFLIHFNQKNTF